MCPGKWSRAVFVQRAALGITVEREGRVERVRSVLGDSVCKTPA